MINVEHTEITMQQFDCFVKQVLKNKHFDYIRRKKQMNDRMRLTSLDTLPFGENVLKKEMFSVCTMLVDGIEIQFQDELLYLSIEGLDMTKKRIIIYYYILGFSIFEIAQMLHLKKDTIKVYKCIALKELGGIYESFL